jgi:hypothetical protein
MERALEYEDSVEASYYTYYARGASKLLTLRADVEGDEESVS